MNAQTYGELAGFIWSACNLPRGPHTRNECRQGILPLTEVSGLSGAPVLT